MWITDAFDAAAFAAAPSGLWTVEAADVITCEYTLLAADTLAVNWVIGNTQVSGSPIGLKMRLPGGYAAAKRVELAQYWEEGSGGKFMGWCDLNPAYDGGHWIVHYKLATATGPVPWSNLETSVHGSAVVSVVT